MGPPTAASFLAQDPDLLPHGNPCSRPDCWVDEFQVAVTVIPVTRIANVNDVVTAFGRYPGCLASQHVVPRGGYNPISCRDHIDRALTTTHVQAKVVVNLFFC